MICRLLYFVLQDRLGVDLSDASITVRLPEDIYPARLYGMRCRVIPSENRWIDVEARGYRLAIL